MKVLISYGTSGLTQYSVGPDVLATIKSFPLICLPTLVTPCSFASQTVALLGGRGRKGGSRERSVLHSLSLHHQ